jgi:hypothetical protein
MLTGFPATTLSFFVTSFISLFVIVDPTGNILPFLALCSGLAPGTARAMAGRACLFGFLILPHPGLTRYLYCHCIMFMSYFCSDSPEPSAPAQY